MQTMKTILDKARASHYAVGAFNIYNLETAGAVLDGAEASRSPVIVAFGERYLAGFPIKAVAAIVRTLAETVSVPVALHLDHAQKLSSIEQAIAAGFTSVMIDGSKLPFEENVALTKQAVALAKPAGVSVEAELGRVVRTGEAVPDLFTDPGEAERFVAATGVDALAVAVGTVHGLYKGTPTLDLKRLEQISRRVSLPLVLHGGSGVPDHLIQASMKLGVAKLNINTEMSVQGVTAVRDFLANQYTPNTRYEELALKARQAMTEVVKKYIEFLGSSHAG